MREPSQEICPRPAIVRIPHFGVNRALVLSSVLILRMHQKPQRIVERVGHRDLLGMRMDQSLN